LFQEQAAVGRRRELVPGLAEYAGSAVLSANRKRGKKKVSPAARLHNVRIEFAYCPFEYSTAPGVKVSPQ